MPRARDRSGIGARALALSADQHTETIRTGCQQPEPQLYRSGRHRRVAAKPARRQRDRRMRSLAAGAAGLQYGRSGHHQSSAAHAARHRNVSVAVTRPRSLLPLSSWMSGSAGYFCRAEAGSFWIALQQISHGLRQARAPVRPHCRASGGSQQPTSAERRRRIIISVLARVSRRAISGLSSLPIRYLRRAHSGAPGRSGGWLCAARNTLCSC